MVFPFSNSKYAFSAHFLISEYGGLQKESINTKIFETYAKANDLEFVTKEENIIVCFPREIKFEENSK